MAMIPAVTMALIWSFAAMVASSHATIAARTNRRRRWWLLFMAAAGLLSIGFAMLAGAKL